MPRATLIIDGDASALRAALGSVSAPSRRAQATITADSRRGAQERAAIARSEATAATASARAVAQVRREVERTTRARERNASRESVAEARNASRERITTVRAEARERLTAAREHARETTRLLRHHTAEHNREERARTATTNREARERARAEAQAGRQARSAAVAAGRGLATIAGGVASTGGALHGEVQSARERRAGADRTLGNAVRSAGGSSADATAARTRVRAFTMQTGMTYEDVASALDVGQARGSSLEAGAGRTPAQALEESLSIVREANAEGADPGQYLAARGRLAATGLRGDSLTQAMRFGLGAAQSGQIEVDQLLSQGLPGASRLMSQRVGELGPGATEAQRQQAMLGAWRESVATQEVLASSGGRAGHTANTLASLSGAMATPRRQEMALNNIQNAEAQINTSTPDGQRRAQALHNLYSGDQALFERDPTRVGNAMRLRQGVSPIELATRVAGATGGNAQAGANIFAGGGPGNAQAFLVNMRNLMGVLGGEQGQRVQQMMGGPGLTGERIAEHRRDVEGDDLSTLNRNQAEHDNKLTDNTSALVTSSNALRDLATRNPVETRTLEGGKEIATGLLGGGALGGGSLLSRIGGGARGLFSRGAGFINRLGGPVAAAVDILTTNSNERGVREGGEDEVSYMRRARAWRQGDAPLAPMGQGPNESRGPPTTINLSRESVAALGAELRNAPPVASITPHAAAHAASAALPRR